jgi:hypothetical protein
MRRRFDGREESYRLARTVNQFDRLLLGVAKVVGVIAFFMALAMAYAFFDGFCKAGGCS